MGRFRECFDEAAFDDLVSRHCRVAFAFARCLLRDDTAAEDAVQAAFIRVVRRRHRYDPSRPFTPWFRRILRNICLDAARREARHVRRLAEFAEAAVVDARPTSDHGEWLTLLGALAPEDRELLALRFVQGLSFSEIADSLACSVEAAKKRGQRALARLRQAQQQTEEQVLTRPVSRGTAEPGVPACAPRPGSLSSLQAVGDGGRACPDCAS